MSKLKVEIRLLRDTYKIKKAANDAFDTEDVMFEMLNTNIQNGNYPKHNCDQIYYPGEEKNNGFLLKINHYNKCLTILFLHMLSFVYNSCRRG